MSIAIRESQRDSVSQPRVAESARLPWVTRSIDGQPQRGCVSGFTPIRRNPVGVDEQLIRDPRVVASLQPWANGLCPVGASRVLARHYGFTAEELDFILNYDIKYHLGRDPEAEDE